MSNGSFIFYDGNGVIHKVMEMDTEGMHVLPGHADDSLQLVDAQAASQLDFQALLVEKPAMTPTITTDGLAVTVSGAPEDAIVTLGGSARALVTQGEATILAQLSGQHQLRVTHPQYLQFQAQVELEEPQS